MKIAVEARPPSKAGVVRILFRHQKDRLDLVPAVSESEFSAKKGQLLWLREQATLYVGLGAPDQITDARVRRSAGIAVMHLKRIGQKRLGFSLSENSHYAGPAVEGAILADYRFERFKENKTGAIETLHLEVGRSALATARAAVARATTIAEATNFCREIGNLPGNFLYPEVLAAEAVRMARKRGLKATVLNEVELEKRGFGGILAVGAGSVRPPRLIVLEHRGGPRNERPLVLVGKAITFDTGGISIKPAANMEEMIFDKCGGMAVLGAIAAIADLQLKRNVVAVIASAENMPGPSAYRPGDIVRAYDGTHIEVINTDAEGRVVLGDAIAFAREDLRASAIIDLATLTGACGVALGEYAAGFWKNDDAFGAAVEDAGNRAGERIWLMPSFSEYDDQIRSDVGDLKNTGGRLGGACTAAAFLKAFARQTPWAHLDIAYMSHREKDQSHLARGASGFGVRLLVELAEAWGRS